MGKQSKMKNNIRKYSMTFFQDICLHNELFLIGSILCISNDGVVKSVRKK